MNMMKRIDINRVMLCQLMSVETVSVIDAALLARFGRGALTAWRHRPIGCEHVTRATIRVATKLARGVRIYHNVIDDDEMTFRN